MTKIHVQSCLLAVPTTDLYSQWRQDSIAATADPNRCYSNNINKTIICVSASSLKKITKNIRLNFVKQFPLKNLKTVVDMQTVSCLIMLVLQFKYCEQLYLFIFSFLLFFFFTVAHPSFGAIIKMCSCTACVLKHLE